MRYRSSATIAEIEINERNVWGGIKFALMNGVAAPEFPKSFSSYWRA